MKITRDVINDLLPVYLAGEASADTRALLEDYLRDNPALAAEVRSQADKNVAVLGSLAAALPADHERETVERIRQVTRQKNQFTAFGAAFALVPFGFAFGSDGIKWIMIRDNPKQAILFFVCSALCFVARTVLARRTSRT